MTQTLLYPSNTRINNDGSPVVSDSTGRIQIFFSDNIYRLVRVADGVELENRGSQASALARANAMTSAGVV